MPTSDSPTVESIFVYPVKSCYRVQMQECEVDNLGIKYDRRFMIVVADSDNFITQRYTYKNILLIQKRLTPKKSLENILP
jgi:uncharacterized protein YcbX